MTGGVNGSEVAVAQQRAAGAGEVDAVRRGGDAGPRVARDGERERQRPRARRSASNCESLLQAGGPVHIPLADVAVLVEDAVAFRRRQRPAGRAAMAALVPTPVRSSPSLSAPACTDTPALEKPAAIRLRGRREAHSACGGDCVVGGVRASDSLRDRQDGGGAERLQRRRARGQRRRALTLAATGDHTLRATSREEPRARLRR